MGTDGGFDVPISCMISPGVTIDTMLLSAPRVDATNPVLLNKPEFVRTAANSSDVNLVHLSEGYAVLGPAKPPRDLDFQAISFGSQTSCRALTGLCGANPTDSMTALVEDFNFVCNATIAGLNMTGNFLNVLAPLNESGLSSGPAVTDTTQDHKNYFDPVVLGGNTIAGSSFSIGFQYFNDSQRLAQTPKLDKYYGSGEDRNQLYWASVWWTPFTTVLTNGDAPSGMNNTLAPVTNGTAAVSVTGAVGVTAASKGGSVGILSCETNISEVVRCSRTNSRNSFGNVSTDILLQQRHHGYHLFTRPKDERIYPLCRRHHRP